MKMIQVSEDALESIKKMAEQDAKDAARYRELKELYFYESGDYFIAEVRRSSVDWHMGTALDESLDAYMQSDKK